MKLYIPTTVLAVVLLAGCSAPPEAPAPTLTATTVTAEPLEEAIVEAVELAPAVDGGFLPTFKEELRTLPGGPYEQLMSDTEAEYLGEMACYNLSLMSAPEALFLYASDPQNSELAVANYNAALNTVPGRIC